MSPSKKPWDDDVSCRVGRHQLEFEADCPHCVTAQAARLWWEEVELGLGRTLGAGERMDLAGLLRQLPDLAPEGSEPAPDSRRVLGYDAKPGRPRFSHLDELILSLGEYFHRATGQEPKIRVRNGSNAPRDPFGRLLALVCKYGLDGIVDAKGTADLLRRARDILKQAGDPQRFGGSFLKLRNVTNNGARNGVKLRGLAPGESLVVRGADGVPLEAYWRRRLEEGAVEDVTNA